MNAGFCSDIFAHNPNATTNDSIHRCNDILQTFRTVIRGSRFRAVLDKFRVDDILELCNLGIDISKSTYNAMMEVRMPRMAATYHYDGDLLMTPSSGPPTGMMSESIISFKYDISCIACQLRLEAGSSFFAFALSLAFTIARDATTLQTQLINEPKRSSAHLRLNSTIRRSCDADGQCVVIAQARANDNAPENMWR